MNTTDAINQYCGDLRRGGYEAIHRLAPKTVGSIVETGCLRTWPSCPDGASTVIFSALGEELSRPVHSMDINESHIAKAGRAIDAVGAPNVQFHVGDSIYNLGRFTEPVGVLMLDSYDHEFSKPLASQRHVMGELGAIWKNMSDKCIIAIDDFHERDGGKVGIAFDWILERNMKLEYKGYVVVFSRGLA